MNELMRDVIGAVLPGNKERLFYLQEKIEADFFTGSYRDLWVIMNRVGMMTGGEVLSRRVLDAVLDRSLELPLERRAAIEDVFDDCAANSSAVGDAEFKSFVNLLVEDYQKNRLGEGLTEAMEILTAGIRKGGDIVYGVDPAIEALYGSVAEVERVNHGVMPEGNILEERDEILEEFQQSKYMERIMTHLRPLDEMTHGGLGAGELALIAGYAGTGKTFLCTNLAYNFSFLEGKNVVYLTAETLRSQVRNRILVRHSRDPKFGLQSGMSSADLKKHGPDNKILTDEQERIWRDVVEDFTTTTEGRGIIHVAQIPMNAKLSTISAKLNKLLSSFEVDVLIIDSLDLLSPEVRRGTTREELNDILADAKHFATTFNNGRGIRLISPWQTSREAWKKAKEEGRYDKSAMAETAEAERKADLILALLEHPTDNFKLRAQTLKFRDSTPKDFELTIDYDKCYVGADKSVDHDFNNMLLGSFDDGGLLQ